MIISSQQNHTGWLFTTLFIIIISLVEYRLVVLLHADDINNFIQVAQGITTGQAYWRVYQNRLLGPFSAFFLSQSLSISYSYAYMFLNLGLFVLKNLVFFSVSYRLTSDLNISFRYTLYAIVCFLALRDVNWLYLWDFIDIVIFTLLIYGALTHQRNGYFLVLFVVAILNRESGLFIALWLILDALIEKKDSSCFRIHIKLRDPYRLIWGILLLIGGVFLIEYLREVMPIKSVASEVEATSIEVGRHVHIRFFTNLKLIFIQNFSNPTFLLNFLIDILVIGLPIWVIIRLRSSSDVWFKIAFIFLIIYSAIIIFGFVNETRVYNILIPFIIFLNAYFLDNDKMRVIKPA